MLRTFSRDLVLAASFILMLPLASFSQIADSKSITGAPLSQIVGTWQGKSVCAVEGSPCHNEVNIYRFAELEGRPGWFSVSGSKIVNGKEIAMGDGEWKYDAEKHALESETVNGRFRLTVDGNKMEGNLTLKDNTVHRRIYLTREKEGKHTIRKD